MMESGNECKDRDLKDWALVIGIDKYASLPPLRSAVTDATRFAEWLSRIGRLPDKNIILINSPTELPKKDDDVSPAVRHITERLERQGVIRKLREESPENRKLGRRLYFYFSGHGFGPTSDDVGMLMADAKEWLLSRSLGLHHYRMLFQEGLFEEVIYVLDCCRDDERIAKAAEPEFMALVRRGAQPRAKEFILMAAGWGNKAFEAAVTPAAGNPAGTEVQRSGLLTQALLEGLGLYGPPAAIDPLGRVTTLTLAAYVRDRVPELARAAIVSQVPRAEGDGAAEPIVLATFPLDPAEAVTLRVNFTAPEYQSGTLLLLQKTASGEAEYRRRERGAIVDGSPWEVEVRPGYRYVLRHAETEMARGLDLREQPKGSIKHMNFLTDC